jgi:hypothetical protein
LTFKPHSTHGDLTINTLIDYLKNYLELDLTDAQLEELARAISKNPVACGDPS